MGIWDKFLTWEAVHDPEITGNWSVVDHVKTLNCHLWSFDVKADFVRHSVSMTHYSQSEERNTRCGGRLPTLTALEEKENNNLTDLQPHLGHSQRSRELL